jgi:Lon protease-like protein
MLPATIPIFPLPNVVLFPGVFLPLHIFEARYRAMVQDVLGGDRIIGMVLLRPGWKNEYEGRPPVYPVGCAGLVTHAVRLDDGRYNIVLHGLSKFRIVREEDGRAYRVARIEPLAETLADAARPTMRERRQRLEELLATMIDAADQRLPASMPDEELVNALAQYLELEPVERQALLERNDALDRCESLIELLEMKTMVPKDGWGAEPQ